MLRPSQNRGPFGGPSGSLLMILAGGSAFGGLQGPWASKFRGAAGWVAFLDRGEYAGGAAFLREANPRRTFQWSTST